MVLCVLSYLILIIIPIALKYTYFVEKKVDIINAKHNMQQYQNVVASLLTDEDILHIPIHTNSYWLILSVPSLGPYLMENLWSMKNVQAGNILASPIQGIFNVRTVYWMA